MDKIIISIEIALDGDADNGYAQQLAENVANALEHQAKEIGLSPDGPCIDSFRVGTLSDPTSGEHFRIIPVERIL